MIGWEKCLAGQVEDGRSAMKIQAVTAAELSMPGRSPSNAALTAEPSQPRWLILGGPHLGPEQVCREGGQQVGEFREQCPL